MNFTTLRAVGPTSTAPGILSSDIRKYTLETLRATKNKKCPTRVRLVCEIHDGSNKIRYVSIFYEVPLQKAVSPTVMLKNNINAALESKIKVMLYFRISCFRV